MKLIDAIVLFLARWSTLSVRTKATVELDESKALVEKRKEYTRGWHQGVEAGFSQAQPGRDARTGRFRSKSIARSTP